MQPTTNDFSASFQLLVRTVAELQATGRPCLGAALKHRLTSKGFSNQALGFVKFGDFLRAAESAGHVKLTWTVGGDIQVSLSGGPVAPMAAIPPVRPTSSAFSIEGPARVRQDLWNAFNSMTETWLYDREQDRAFRQTSDVPQPGSTRIPSGAKWLRDCMRLFAESQQHDTKARLMQVIDYDDALYQFNNIARLAGVQRDWARVHLQHLLSAIRDWAQAMNLEPRDVVVPYRRPSYLGESATPATAAPAPANQSASPPPLEVTRELNTRLAHLIDSLVTDLIALRGLLQIVGPETK